MGGILSGAVSLDDISSEKNHVPSEEAARHMEGNPILPHRQ
jgi:hypothetical protein